MNLSFILLKNPSPAGFFCFSFKASLPKIEFISSLSEPASLSFLARLPFRISLPSIAAANNGLYIATAAIPNPLPNPLRIFLPGDLRLFSFLNILL